MKKILFIIMSYTKGGGAESLLTTIVNHLNPDKYKIDIIEIVHDEIKKEPVNANITVLPYIMRADDPKRKEKMYYVYHEPEKVFNKFIKKKYDLYVSFNYQRPTFLLPPGEKNIAWIHGDVYNLAQENMSEERGLQDDAFEKVKKIVVISDTTESSVKELFPRHKDKIIKLYNGIDIDTVQKKAERKTDIILQHPAVLFVGRLEKNKAPERLISIMNILHNEMKKDIHLYYMGYGPMEEELIAQAKEYNIDGYVHFLGYLQNPFPIIKQADVCSLLSHSEGFCMCLLEAHTLGKPIVISKSGAWKTLIRNPYCGGVVENANEGAVAIERLLNVDKDIIARYCMQSVERFRLDKYIVQIEELFDTIMDS